MKLHIKIQPNWLSRVQHEGEINKQTHTRIINTHMTFAYDYIIKTNIHWNMFHQIAPRLLV